MRWALVVGAAMAAMALGSAARAHVRTIDLDGCSAGCFASPIDDPPAAKGGAAAKITLSRSGSGAAHPNEPNPALVLDRRTTAAGLTNGLPSPLATADAVLGGVTPYDYFEDVIDIPLSAEARAEFAAVPFFLCPVAPRPPQLHRRPFGRRRLFRQILAAFAAPADVACEGVYKLRDVWRGWNWPIPGAPTMRPSSTMSAPRSSVLVGQPVTSMPS